MLKDDIDTTERIFALLNDGAFLIYDTTRHPALLSTETVPDSSNEVLTCMQALYGNHFEEGESVPQFFLIAGTDSGQICLIDDDNPGEQLFLIQAHCASILELHVSSKNNLVFTLARGSV